MLGLSTLALGTLRRKEKTLVYPRFGGPAGADTSDGLELPVAAVRGVPLRRFF